MGLDNLTAYWNQARDSLWFVPALLTFGSVLLALGTIQLDTMDILPGAPAGVWLFSGTASGARGVLTAIASGFITVTGVVFSVTIVALQLASTQFTPRILRNFTADRVNQLVLGIFIATFTYALLVLRVVRGTQDDAGPGRPPGQGAGPPGAETLEAFVPNLSVTVAVALALVGIGFLIYFIDHAARSVQAAVIIDRVTQDTLRTLDRLLPSIVGEPIDDDADAVTPEAPGSIIDARGSGYLQGVDQDALLELLGHDALTIRMEREIGDFILPGTTLAVVWPAGLAEDDAVGDAIREALILGHERTPHLDFELGLIELVDIAVKALSPGINDPTTATLCVDRIAEVLVSFARRELPGRIRRVSDGRGVLILPRTDFDRLVAMGFSQIRHFGMDNPHFTANLLHRIEHLGRLLPRHQTPPLARQAAAVAREARHRFSEPGDRAAVQRAACSTLRSLGVGSDR